MTKGEASVPLNVQARSAEVARGQSFHLAVAAMCVTGEDARILEANDAFQRVFGACIGAEIPRLFLEDAPFV